MRLELVPLVERSSEEIIEVWEKARSNWHFPQLPRPSIGVSPGKEPDKEFPFQNYQVTISRDILDEGELYLENLFDHLIVHYIFCPRSLEMAGSLALSAIRGLKDHSLAKRMVNIFSDIASDSFRLERSQEDEEKVILGWRRLANAPNLSEMDRAVLGFLKEYWGSHLPGCDLPEVDLLLQVYSLGIRDKGIWGRQCQQTASILESLIPGVLGHGQVRSLEILNGSAASAPLAGLACSLEPERYQEALQVLGLKGDLKRWYRDQSYSIVIKQGRKIRESLYPSGLVKWRFTDPPSQIDIPYSMSLSPVLIPGITTYKREEESSRMAEGREAVPDLLVILDSSRSMDGPRQGTKTHKATLAAFKACQFAHSQGAEVAAVNFSNTALVQGWTRDLSAVEDVLVEYICSQTHIPGKAILELAKVRKGCLILCITDTHIQNLYLEWDHIKEAAEVGDFVLFSIDQAGRDKQVDDALKSLGRVYYINELEDLIALVVETAEMAYGSHSGHEVEPVEVR
ncbi:MAG TPA: VWA domain-containing protein [Methanotrichaceae archaeon]|nr:VWA domain-containing protein [Methanotrichaceae archaeon]